MSIDMLNMPGEAMFNRDLYEQYRRLCVAKHNRFVSQGNKRGDPEFEAVVRKGHFCWTWQVWDWASYPNCLGGLNGPHLVERGRDLVGAGARLLGEERAAFWRGEDGRRNYDRLTLDGSLRPLTAPWDKAGVVPESYLDRYAPIVEAAEA